MKKELNILMIDDHPMIIEGYKKVLLTNKEVKLNITTANNCDEAIFDIQKAKNTVSFDVVFIDIQLPVSSDGTITSGEDLAVLVREEFPGAKIIILTMFDNSHRLQNILQTIPHNGLLIKSDITSKLLLTAFSNILDGDSYYSKSVEKIRTITSSPDDTLDEFNKKIIFYLAKGVKTKNLVQYIPLSLSAIEKRKNFIKQVFNVSGDDEQLLIEAKKRGFI
jgi:two-component system response regulator NreC